MSQTLTRSDASRYVTAILDIVPDWLTPQFAGQMRLETALITRFDVVLHAEAATPPDFSMAPVRLNWIQPSADLSIGEGYIEKSGEMPITFWVCSGEALGAVMLTATGPVEFVLALRRKATRKGFKLYYNGLFQDNKRLDDGSERNIFHLLDSPWIEPADRSVFGRPDTDQEIIEREVAGSKGNTYLVRILGDRASCPCAGFQHRKACRHLTQVRQELGLNTPLKTEVLP